VTPREPVFVVVRPANYLSISGHGAPGGEHFQLAIGALYAVAFTIKMKEKFAGHDYKVCHLEGQWWVEDATKFRARKPEEWQWRLLIRVPDFVTQEKVDAAIKSVMSKDKAPLAGHVKLERLDEGRCVQALHIGAYRDESPAFDKLQKKAEGEGLHIRGPHHEIYLSDPRRVPEERLRTILRYPVG
jgi:hypothetical protein